MVIVTHESYVTLILLVTLSLANRWHFSVAFPFRVPQCIFVKSERRVHWLPAECDVAFVRALSICGASRWRNSSIEIGRAWSRCGVVST